MIGNDGVVVNSSLKSSSPYTIPSHTKLLTWYSCGPTVYDSAHLGHARTYVTTDIIRRILLNKFHYEVNFAMGMTDIDDKILHKAKSAEYYANESVMDKTLRVARLYENEFLQDMDAMNILRPNVILRVTEHINEIIEYLEDIESKGYTYLIEDGLYFDLSAFERKHEYGKLDSNVSSSRELNENENRNEIVGKDKKRNPRDFVLWKTAKEGEPNWSSRWGPGRPGWHIECSAMTQAYFGRNLDIHSGGIDLKFPHHSNEIAQWYSPY